jgi:tubulin gamma
MFADGLEEFDASREVVQDMIDEYQAMESPGYATFGSEESGEGVSAAPDPRMVGRM